MLKKIFVFDTTLRDGEQIPGAKLNTVEKIEIAKQLETLGVDIIEAGFPISSPEDSKAVSKIAKTIKKSTICALARGLDTDIDEAAKALKGGHKTRIHTFISASDIHIKNQMKKTRKEVLKMVKHAVSRARKYADDVEFSPMDASRADLDYLVEFINVAIDAGATTINVPDTVGYALPNEWGKMINRLVNRIPKFKDEVILSVHSHNDLGLATATTLAAVQNGARQIECTINGLGERAGNCSLEEIVMILKTRYKNNYDLNIRSQELYKTSRMVSQIMGIPVQPNKAIVGSNAFAHSSGIHQDGLIKHRENFEIMNPQDIGLNESGILLTARSGRSALKHRLEKIGYEIDRKDIDPIYDKFLEIADQKKEVYDEDLRFIMGDAEEEEHKFELEQVQVLCGNKNIPMAVVKIMNTETDATIQQMATGTGPIDAAFGAVDKIMDIKAELKEFLIQAITEGIDATGKVSVKIEYKDKEYFGYGSDDDIVVASTKAYIEALNRIQNGTT